MSKAPDDIYRSSTLNAGSGRAVLILTANDTEDLEFFYPYYRFSEAGFRVEVVTPAGGAFAAKHGIGLKETKAIDTARHEDFALLYIPGGKAPASLRTNDAALSLVRAFVDSKKPIASICHGPQILASANVIRGVKITCWPDVESEVAAAGGIFVNEPTVSDGLFITARWPGDLPSHMKVVFEKLQNLSDNDVFEPHAAA